MGFSLKNIGKKLEDVLGVGTDIVLPGNQGFLHPNAPQGVQNVQQAVQRTVNPAIQTVGKVVSPLAQSTASYLNTTNNLINPVNDLAVKVAQNHNPIQALKDQANDTRKAANDYVINPIESGVSQTAAQLGHPTSVPSIAGFGGVNKLPSFTKNVQQAQGVTGKAGAVLQDVGNAASLVPVVGEATKPIVKSVDAGAKVLSRDPLINNEVGAIGKKKVSLKGDTGPVEPSKLPNTTPQPAPEPVAPQTPVGKSTSVIPSSSKTTTAEQFAKQGLGMTNDQIAAAKLPSELTAATPASLEAGIKNTRNLVQSTQIDPRVKEATQYAIDREKSAANNPVKVKIPEVNAGDYAKARSNTQLVSNPIRVMGEHAAQAVDKLSSEDKARFFRDFVEHPETIKTAKDPGAVAESVARFRSLADTSHATDRALGGRTGYLDNYSLGHTIDAEGTDQAVRDAIAGGKQVAPEDFQGINNNRRVAKTIAEGESMGIKYKKMDPAAEIRDYATRSATGLRKQALIKGVTEADAKNADKFRSLDLGNGQTLPLSRKAVKEVKAFEQRDLTNNKAVKGLRTTNTGLKSTLLSASQFHPINISLLRAAPTLALKGHPVAAAKGAYRTFRAAFGEQYAQQVIGKAIDDGMVENAARIGMPYSEPGYNTEGTFLKGGVGEHTVFQKQMPMMHDQVVRSIVKDLNKKGVSLDSPEARKAGLVGNEMMGFINKDVQNLSPRVRQVMTDWLLAGQFTPSKILITKDALTKGGVAGSYARRATVANVAAAAAVSGGIGYLLKQNSDNVRDTLLRALIDPAVPTPLQDEKGNTIKLRLPGTNTSDIAKLLGVTLVRGDDGHLDVNWKPSNMPSTVEDYLRARLSPLASTAVKVATNTSFGNKPLYDPAASIGKKAAQAGTSVGVGALPIGLQGLAYTDAVKNHVPGNVKEILDADTPGSSPLLKSLGSSLGLTPATDQTVGKGQQTAQYFAGLDQAKKGLNRQEQDAFDVITGGKKNPVTDQYEISPTVYDSTAKAELLLQNPKVLENLTNLNKGLADKGQKVDPFYTLPADQQRQVLQINRLDPQNPDKTQLVNQAGRWYNGFKQAQSDFFGSLPAGDPNKPKAPVQYQEPSQQAQDLATQYYKIDDSAQRAAFIKANPAVQDAFDATAKYDKDIRAARGLPTLKGYPTASPALQSKLDTYDALGSKDARSAYGKANPDVYNYFEQVTKYSLENGATQARYQGNDLTPKDVKSIVSLANDVKYNGGITGDNGQIIAPTGGATSSGGSSGKKYASKVSNSRKYAVSTKKAAKPKVAKLSKSGAVKIASKGTNKPKVSIKKSLV